MGPPPGAVVNLEERRVINPAGVVPLEGFSSAVKIGKRIYVSGQVALDSSGNVVGGSNLEEQAAQAFRNLQTIMLAAGGTPEDVVQLDLYLVAPARDDLAAVRRAGAAFFPAGRAPAGNIVAVQSLPAAGLRIAISAIAETRGLFPDREAQRRFQ